MPLREASGGLCSMKILRATCKKKTPPPKDKILQTIKPHHFQNTLSQDMRKAVNQDHKQAQSSP